MNQSDRVKALLQSHLMDKIEENLGKLSEVMDKTDMDVASALLMDACANFPPEPTGNKPINYYLILQKENTVSTLTSQARQDREQWEDRYDDCTCHINPPCGSCLHPGNPVNQEDDPSCWEPEEEIELPPKRPAKKPFVVKISVDLYFSTPAETMPAWANSEGVARMAEAALDDVNRPITLEILKSTFGEVSEMSIQSVEASE